MRSSTHRLLGQKDKINTITNLTKLQIKLFIDLESGQQERKVRVGAERARKSGTEMEARKDRGVLKAGELSRRWRVGIVSLKKI